MVSHKNQYIDKANVFIIMPAKDEGSRIGKVIKNVRGNGYDNVVVINDGSGDDTADVARSFGATVLTHSINLGPGAATQTGISYAVSQGAQVIVTMDSDNQHKACDIDVLVTTLIDQQLDIVIGSRFLNKENKIPKQRIFYNKVGNWVTYMITGLKVTDSQSGMKAFSGDFARQWELTCNGFEFCMEIIWNIQRHSAKYIEIPIKVTYSKESMSKGQNLLSGFRMLGRVARSFYLTSSR